MAYLLILVLERKLAPTVGPLLRTLARLCVNPINPSRDVAVWVLFDCRCNDVDDDDDVENDDDDDDDDDDDHDDGNESGGREASVVFVGVQNSMGLALFLDLAGTLPTGSGSGSGSGSDIGDVPSPEEVERETECAGWQYPTLILRERD